MISTTQTPAQAARLSAGLIVLCAVLWGTVGVTTRALYNLRPEANALSIGFFRLAFSAPVLWLLLWRSSGAQLWRVQRRDLGLMLLIGATMALYQACYFAAIPRLGVTAAVIITICSAPVIVAVLAAIFLNETFTLQIGLALAAAIAGTVALSLQQPAGPLIADQTLPGVVFALGAGASYAILTLCSRALAGRYHPLQPISLGFTAGALILLPVALATGFTATYSAAGWGLLIYLGVAPTALAYWLFLWGMRHTTATVASILTLLEPLTSALLAALLFQERLEPLGWLGAALLLGAMTVLLGRKKEHG
jgi:DME family drug/metabolite transporter